MNYTEWLASLDATAAAHEISYDAAAVRGLAGDVRAGAEAELVRRVAAGDVLAFATVGELGLTAAISHLEVHKDASSAWVRGAAARALFDLRGDGLPKSDDALMRGLDAWTLKQSPRAEAIPALFPLLADPGVQARVHAAEGLIAKLGLSALAEVRGSPLSRMTLAHSSQLPTLWPLAAAELRDALRAVHEGASVDAAGLHYVPTTDPHVLAQFWEQCIGWKAFGLDNVRAMSEHDRAFAETVLVSRLRSGDVNALDAVATLGVVGWKAHARAALPNVAKDARITRAYEDALRASAG